MSALTFAKALHRAGRPMELKRRIGTTSTFTTCTVHGKDSGYQPHEFTGGVVQGDRHIRIAQADITAANWPGPPKKNDLLDNGAVQGAQALYDRAELVGFVCWVRG